MRAIICGGRAFEDRDALFRTLDDIHSTTPITVVIHGGARGADQLAGEWGAERELPVIEVKAHWAQLGPPAGPIRNQWMLLHCAPDIVIAFPGGKGTTNMIEQATEAGVKVKRISGQ